MNRKLEALFVSVGIVCMIVGLVALAQSSTPSGGPYYLQVPTSTWTYQIGVFSNGSYYMVNGSNWNVDYQSTNASKIFDFALGNITSGTIYVTKASYLLDTAIYMKNHTRLEAEKGATLTTTTNTLHMVRFYGTSGSPIVDAQLIGFNILHSASATSGNAIYLTYTYECLIRDCNITYGLNCIQLINCYQNTFDNNYFGHAGATGNLIIDSTGVGNNYIGNYFDGSAPSPYECFIADSDSIIVSNNHFIGYCVASVLKHQIYITGHNTMILGNEFQGTTSSAGTGVELKGYSTMFSGNTMYNYTSTMLHIAGEASDTHISGNTFENATVDGIQITAESGFTNKTGVVISDNMIKNVVVGIYVMGGGVGAGYVSGTIITGNTIMTTSSDGIKIDGDATPDDIRNTLVENNIIRYASGSGVRAYNNNYNTTITRNTFEFCSKAVETADASATDVVIESNLMAFTNTYKYVNNGGTRVLVRWNNGFKTEGSASSNNATTTTWTFTMNNATTVIRAYISFNSTVADPYWSATGNTLTVTTGTIIAANNTACYVEWYCWNYP